MIEYEAFGEELDPSDPHYTKDIANVCIIIGCVCTLPLTCGLYFFRKSSWKSFRWGLYCLVCLSLVILNIWTGVKDQAVEATVAVNVVAVVIGGFSALADWCMYTCQAAQEKRRAELDAERQKWLKE